MQWTFQPVLMQPMNCPSYQGKKKHMCKMGVGSVKAFLEGCLLV